MMPALAELSPISVKKSASATDALLALTQNLIGAVAAFHA